MADGTLNLTPTRFWLDSVIEPPVDGFTAGARWNGWACPYFTREQADRVVELSNAANNSEDADVRIIVTWDEARQAYIIVDGQYPDEEDVMDAVVVDGVAYYCIGGWSWCWMETHTVLAQDLLPQDFLVDDGFEVVDRPRWCEADDCWAVAGSKDGHPFDRLFRQDETVEVY